MKKYISLSVCLALFILHAIPSNSFSQTVEKMKELTANELLARDIFKELIETNTTAANGITKAVELLATRLREAGFPEKNIHILGAEPKNMNLVIRYPGKGLYRPILFLGHLDVVEAQPEDWSMDPFKFIEKEGYFYGRGTSDIKCEDANLVANIIRLFKEGYLPDRDIIVALTANEEGGEIVGVEWLLKNHRDLIDADFCINPDGGSGEIKNGKYILMDIQTSEKIYFDFNLECKNKGGHSSIPVKDNAIYHLAGGLTRLADYEFPIKLNETTRLFFERTAEQQTGQLKEDMLAVGGSSLNIEAANRLAKVSPLYNSMMRTTCVATMLSGGHAQNALPQYARANVNCRMLPGESADDLMATLQSVIADSQVLITVTNADISSPLSKLREDVMNPLEKLTSEMWPGVIVTPAMSTGATDGRFFRAAGIPVFGVSGIFSDIDDIRAHGRDERIGVLQFYQGVEFMYRFMKALTSGN